MEVPATVKAFFVSEQRTPLHRSTVNLLLEKYSAASLPLHAHPHRLRLACGFALADQGADTPADPGLPGTPLHSAHRQVHCEQPGAVSEALAMTSPTAGLMISDRPGSPDRTRPELLFRGCEGWANSPQQTECFLYLGLMPRGVRSPGSTRAREHGL